MQLFYQGQLDFFCAVYSVINALAAIFRLNLPQARAFFASTLNDVSQHPTLWQATLENKTDFDWLTAYMLAGCHRGSAQPIFAYRPFATGGPKPVPESARDLQNAVLFRAQTDSARFSGNKEEAAVWAALEQWLPPLAGTPAAGTAKRAVVLRFHRYVPYMNAPIISHWSTADRFCANTLHLRDASKEESALHALSRPWTAVHKNGVCAEKYVLLEPESLFFLERL